MSCCLLFPDVWNINKNNEPTAPCSTHCAHNTHCSGKQAMAACLPATVTSPQPMVKNFTQRGQATKLIPPPPEDRNQPFICKGEAMVPGRQAAMTWLLGTNVKENNPRFGEQYLVSTATRKRKVVFALSQQNNGPQTHKPARTAPSRLHQARGSRECRGLKN